MIDTIENIKKILELNQNNAIAHNKLGDLYLKQNKFNKALIHYKKAALLQPQNKAFQHKLANILYSEMGDIEEAMKIYVNILSIAPEDVETLLIVGHISLSMKQFDNAQTFYQRVLEIDPSNFNADKSIKNLQNIQNNNDTLHNNLPREKASTLICNDKNTVDGQRLLARHKMFDLFMKRISNEVYAEKESQYHTYITNHMLPKFIESRNIPKDAKILDVGCGKGLAIKKLEELGYNAVGITLSEEDYNDCKKSGYECHLMDQTFMDFKSKSFDILWCRHVLEHSPFPYLTLLEYNRVIKMNGLIYLEMPSPGEYRKLEYIINHYSVMGKDMWEALFSRSGFKTINFSTFNVELNDPEKESTRWTETKIAFIVKKIKEDALDKALVPFG